MGRQQSLQKPAAGHQLSAPFIKLFNRIIEFYHTAFTEDPKAKEYLNNRGITDTGIFLDYTIGFANGTLLNVLPDNGEINQQLTELGILDRKGKEYFYGCLTFPVHDTDGNMSGMIAHPMNVRGPERSHLYLPHKQYGLFNHQSLNRHSETGIILTDSILDALTLIQAGFRNTVFFDIVGDDDDAVSGLKPLFEEKRGRFYTLWNGKIKNTYERIFRKIGIQTFPLTLPDGLDVPGFFQTYQKDAKERFIDLMNVDGPSSLQKVDIQHNPINHTEYGFTTTINERIYDIRGVKRTETSLKVTIKAILHEGGKKRFHLDTVDLYSIRSRNFLIKGLCDLFGEDTDAIMQDIDILMEMVEGYHPETVDQKEQEHEITDEDRKTALSLLKNPDMLKEILSDFQTIGCTGEETNKLLCYIAAISRKTDNPLSVMIQSRSAAGKSFLQDSVLSLMPESDFIKYTRLTDQALFYQGKDSLKHKILAIEELDGMDGAIYSIRSIQSSKKITIAYTGKDSVTGKSRTEENMVEGPLMVFITTTKVNIDGETASRFMFVSIDESEEMTREILCKQREAHTMEGMISRLQSDAVIQKHKNANRLLKPRHVLNPYANLLTFNSKSLRARRDHTKYLNLISAIAFMFQYQRETHIIEVNGDVLEYVNVSISDIEKANQIAGEVLGGSLDDLSPPSRTLLGLIREMVKEQCSKQGIKPEEFRFTRRDIRDYSKWSDFQVKTHIRQLVELEYIYPVSGKKGKQYVYELMAENCACLDDENPVLAGLMDTEKLKQKADKLNIRA